MIAAGFAGVALLLGLLFSYLGPAVSALAHRTGVTLDIIDVGGRVAAISAVEVVPWSAFRRNRGAWYRAAGYRPDHRSP